MLLAGPQAHTQGDSPSCPRYLQGTLQLLVALGRGRLRPRSCSQHGQGVMPEKSKEAARARERGCEQGDLGYIQSQRRELAHPTRQSPQPQSGVTPSPVGDAPARGMLLAPTLARPRSPFEVLLDQMLIEILQLRLQELHEGDDGLQREERGIGEGAGGASSRVRLGEGGVWRAPSHSRRGRAWRLHPQAPGCHWRLRAPGCVWRCPLPAAREKHTEALGLCTSIPFSGSCGHLGLFSP